MENLKPIGIKDFFNYKFLSNINISEDGKTTVFAVKCVDEKNNSYSSYLYMQRGRKTTRLTGSGKDSNFIFDGNDAIYIFVNREDKDRADALEQFTPVYRLSLKGGEAEKVFEIPANVQSVKVLDKNTWVLTADIDKRYPDYYKLSKKEQDKINKEYKDNKDYEEVDESPFWFNGPGFVNGKRNALFLFDLKKKKLERISGATMEVHGFEFFDGKIYFTANDFNGKRGFGSGLYTYDFASKTTEQIADNSRQIYTGFIMGGEYYALICKAEKYGINENPAVFKPVGKKLVEQFDGDRSYGSSVGSDVRMGKTRELKAEGERLYFIETVRNKASLFWTDKTGEKHTVYDGEGTVEDFDVKNGKIVLTLLKSDELQELYELQDGKLTKLTSLNKDALRGKYIGKPEKFGFTSKGLDLDGWIIYPINYEPGKKYPGILVVHGGPKTVYGDAFYHEMRYWAGQGYFVFFTNPKGGDGRGNEFADIRGKYGTVDYENLMDFTDYVLKHYPDIDPSNIFETGGSYGGFMTNWIVGHTDRFKAAASQRSISNWTSFEGVSDIGPEFGKDQNACSFREDPEKVWDRSPIKYVNNVKTPTLFIHSDQDYRCPLEQGIQFYTAIRQNGVDAKMVIFHGETHELSRSGKPLHRVKRLDEITKWFDSHKG